jgi:hypothetical protein
MENMGDLIPIGILAVILVVGLVSLKVAFKITTTLFRIGCVIIVLIVLAGLALTFLVQ